jgi:hypothetical protein
LTPETLLIHWSIAPRPKSARDFNPGRCRGRMTRSWREPTRHFSEPSNNDARTIRTREPRGDSEKEPAAVDKVRRRRHFQTKRIEMVTRISRVNSFWLVLSWALCRTFVRLTLPIKRVISRADKLRSACLFNRRRPTGSSLILYQPARIRADRKPHLIPAGIAGSTPRGIKLRAHPRLARERRALPISRAAVISNRISANSYVRTEAAGR